MTEAKKMIFFTDDLQMQAFGWNKNPGHFISTQKEMPSQALTMMFWVKQNEIDISKYDGFFTMIKGQTGNLYGFSSGIQESTGYVNAVQQNIAVINTDYRLQPNIWTHLGYTRDVTGTIIKIYVNGQLVKTQIVRAQTGLPDTIVIGDDNGYILAKDMAKLSIYGSELTQEEIQSEVNTINVISRKDDLLALFIDGVHDGSLIDFCGNYNIMCNDKIENRGVFKL